MNNEYRRGTVLGLTIVEIFILLIFLVLLALLGLANSWAKKEKEYLAAEEEYLAAQQVLSEWKDVIEEFRAPEEIRTLHSRTNRLEQQLAEHAWKDVKLSEEIEPMREEQERLRDENTKLSHENSALQEELDSLRENAASARRDADRRTAALQEEIRTLHSRANRLEQQLAEHARKDVKLSEEIEPMREEQERLRDENTKLSHENSALQEELDSLRENAASARRDADRRTAALQEEIETIREQRDELSGRNKKLSDRYAELREERNALRERVADAKQAADRIKAEFDTFRRKGQNPPCWYETVADGDGTREKPHYLFDIAVQDEHMVVRRRPIPAGLADDDHGRPYTEEATELGLEDIPFDKPLTDAEMNQHMKPIRDIGKKRKMRSYSCIFWVKVWDRTSPDAKERWKEAHDGILERLFGTYIVKDDLWSAPS